MNAGAAAPRPAGRPYVPPSPAVAEGAEQAAQLDKDNPLWVIVWGTYSLQFVAFPLFHVPPGTVLCCQSGAELVRQMRQAEAIYGAAPHGEEKRHA